ncbi:MAG TPA: hypothetical protein VMX13_07825 [Sedimentisphaerales bacterium]|nr:hypothetical protein [Sedimentisphaerales bacterium]
MKNRMTKYAAAAVIMIIGLTIWVSIFGGPPDGATAAWAKTLQNMQAMPWLHVITEIRLAQGSEVEEWWRCFDPSIRAFTYSDGRINYANYSEGVGYSYDGRENVLWIHPVTEKYNVPGARSPLAQLSHRIEQMKERGIEVVRREFSRLEGRRVEIIHTSSGVRMVRDVERNLLVSSEGKIQGSPGTFRTTYHYPDEGLAGVYALGVPRDAETIDLRPNAEVSKLLREIQRRFDEGYGDHIAMVLHSWAEQDGGLKPWQVVMLRQQGERERVDVYTAGDFKHLVSLYGDIKDHWPDLTIQQVEEYERNDAISWQKIYDGTYTNIGNRDPASKRIRFNRHRGRMGSQGGGASDSMSVLSWFEPPIYGSPRPHWSVTYEFLDADPNHEGLIGIRIVKGPLKAARQIAESSTTERIRTDPVFTTSQAECYWLDPSRDYLVVERTTFREGKETSRSFTLETKQTGDGRWYPSHIRHEWSEITSESGQTRRLDKRIVLDTAPIFPEDIFNADFMFNAK